MTPAQIIADLDAKLAEAGETLTIRRYTAPSGSPRPKIDLAGIPASVRTVKPEQLAGAIDQTASNVVLSPTGLTLLPLVKGDKAIIQGKERNIEIAKPIYVQNVLVRINLVVLG